MRPTFDPVRKRKFWLDFNLAYEMRFEPDEMPAKGQPLYLSTRTNSLVSAYLLGILARSLMTWFSKQDQYSRPKLAADLETLRSYYLDRGYIEFAIDSTQVSITPDKQDIYITVTITEGARYTVSDIRVAGEKLIPEEEVRARIQLKPGEVFSRSRLTESTKLI